MESEKPIPPIDRVEENLRKAIEMDAAPAKRRRARLAVAIVATAAIAVVAAIGLAGRDAESPFTVQDAVAAVARAAYDQPRADGSSVIYRAVRTTNVWSGFIRPKLDVKHPQVVTEERWYRPGDKKGWLRWTIDSHGGAPSGTVITCRTVLARYMPGENVIGELHLRKGTKIPTDSKAAYRLIRSSVPRGYMGSGGDDEVVWQSVIFVMMGGAPKLSPAQRSAVIGSLAYIKGVTTTGPTTDPLGNDAIGFVQARGALPGRIFFDAHTGLTTYFDFVAERDIDQGAKREVIPKGTTTYSRALLDYKLLSHYPDLRQSPKTKKGIAAAMCPELRH
ncbi:MAG: hypothetical protein QM648_11100 [Solirubrobacterales bacterium]